MWNLSFFKILGFSNHLVSETFDFWNFFMPLYLRNWNISNVVLYVEYFQINQWYLLNWSTVHLYLKVIVIPFMNSIIHLGHYGHFTWIISNITISRQNSSLGMPLTKYQLSINKSNFTKELPSKLMSI